MKKIVTFEDLERAIQNDEDKKAAVYSDDKRLLIMGGAGAGKTLALIARAVRFKRENANCSVILLTFTNAATDVLFNLLKMTEYEVYKFGYDIDEEKKKNGIFVSTVDKYNNDYIGYRDFDHYLVDEITDLEWDKVYMFEQMAGEDSSITLAMDIVQTIYKNERILIDDNERKTSSPESVAMDQEDMNRNSFSSFVQENYRQIKLHRVYRSTREIMAFAVQILSGYDYEQVVVDVDPSKLASNGILPEIRRFQEGKVIGLKEVDHILDIIKNQEEDRSLAILCHTNSQIDIIKNTIQSKTDYEFEELDEKKIHKIKGCEISILSIWVSKGLEFDDVVIPFCNDNSYYDYADNLRQLYVAMTRAKQTLVLLCSSSNPYKNLKRFKEGTYENISLK